VVAQPVSDDLAPFWIHDVVIARRTGVGAYTIAYDTPQTVTGFVDDGQRLVVNADGEQVTSTATVFLPADTADVPVQSQVTLPATFGGRVSEVIRVGRRDSGSLDLPDHIEVNLL